ncbi:MAG: divalent metal cation transporter [Planctomycetaceae bacterium]|jgi:Mn2+/Fe2+ NRAMP family transporter|nr:divalent metal cation transporter [Planctomycetaceae bacterium]
MSEQANEPVSVDPKQAQEIELLNDIAKRPFFSRAFGYVKLTGPGLLQGAMTLGAGSAAASVIAGASFGYKLLWVQPVAMFLGVMMFAAVSNIVLSRPKSDRPYWSFMREMKSIWSPLMFIVFLWALGTIMSSVIWHFPQYALAAGAARSVVQKISPEVELSKNIEVEQRDWFGFGKVKTDSETGKPVKAKVAQYTPMGYIVSVIAGAIILIVNIVVVFNYGRGGIGVRVYEWFLRFMMALVFLTFFLVVILNIHKIEWLEVIRGFTGYYGIPYNEDPAEYAKTITVVLGMLGAAVGINMTFLYPYSILKKGWGKEHKALAKWDLGMTLFIPFTLVTSLIMLGMTVSGVYDGKDIANIDIKVLEAAAALRSGGLISEDLAVYIFCGGLFGMTFGAISAHMTCCGFTLCEMFGLEQTAWRFRLFALVPSVGVLGIVFQLPFWFPVVASAVCYTMLPIAYLIFIILSNRRSFIGDAVGKGFKRYAFNVILALALIAAIIGTGIQLKEKVYNPIMNPPSQKKDDNKIDQPPKDTQSKAILTFPTLDSQSQHHEAFVQLQDLSSVPASE